MTNPKAPRRQRASSERESPLEGFVLRMTRLGATADDIAAVRANWDKFDDEWTPEVRDDVIRKSDAELVAMIVAAQQEFDESTMSADELAQRDHDAALRREFSEAHGRMGLSVARIAEWVGDDAVRAQAVLLLEQRENPRKGLVTKMRAVIDKAHGTGS